MLSALTQVWPRACGPLSANMGLTTPANWFARVTDLRAMTQNRSCSALGPDSSAGTTTGKRCASPRPVAAARHAGGVARAASGGAAADPLADRPRRASLALAAARPLVNPIGSGVHCPAPAWCGGSAADCLSWFPRATRRLVGSAVDTAHVATRTTRRQACPARGGRSAVVPEVCRWRRS